MKAVFLYHAEIRPRDGRPPLELDIAWRGVDQARLALAERFRVSPDDIKLKAERGDAGAPREVWCETARDETGEQCWAPAAGGESRCTNIARSGFHTCKLHTIVDVPAPFGTPEYRKWIAREESKTARSRAGRRRRATSETAKGTAPIQDPKPAKPRSRRRANP